MRLENNRNSQAKIAFAYQPYPNAALSYYCLKSGHSACIHKSVNFTCVKEGRESGDKEIEKKEYSKKAALSLPLPSPK